MKCIVFDMGGVLPKKTIGEYISAYTEKEEERSFIKKEIILSVEWIMTDRGTMTDAEAVASICSRTDEKWHPLVTDFLMNFRKSPDPNQPMADLVSKLKKAGYPLYLFSNVGYRYKDFFPFLNPNPLEFTNGLWASCEYKVIKPEPAAYDSFLSTFKLAAEDCFFIDDSPANIEQAIRHGMKGCVYHGDISEIEMALKKEGYEF